jgi:signal transduction histidine kinase
MSGKALQSELAATQEQLRVFMQATKKLDRYLLAGELALEYLHDENHTLSMLASYSTMILKELDTGDTGPRELRELMRDVADVVDVMQVRHGEMLPMINERERFVALTDSVQNSVGLMRRRFDRQRVTLSTRISLEAGRLKVPSHSYRTIVVYLLRDCFGSLSGRGGSVIIGAFVDHDMIVLEVVDEGRSRESEALAHIGQLGGATDDVDLGLWFVKRTVDQLGGTITLENHNVTGTKFVIRTPLRQGDTN